MVALYGIDPYQSNSLTGSGAIVEVNHATLQTAFGLQIEPNANTRGDTGLAASNHDGPNEQVVFIDQPGLYSLGGKFRPGHGDVTICQLFHPQDRIRIELSFDPVLALETVLSVRE